MWVDQINDLRSSSVPWSISVPLPRSFLLSRRVGFTFFDFDFAIVNWYFWLKLVVSTVQKSAADAQKIPQSISLCFHCELVHCRWLLIAISSSVRLDSFRNWSVRFVLEGDSNRPARWIHTLIGPGCLLGTVVVLEVLKLKKSCAPLLRD